MGHTAPDIPYASTAGPDDIICQGRDGEIAGYGHDQEDEVGGICWAEYRMTGAADLRNVQSDHLLLDLPNDGAEDIGHGQPEEDIQLFGQPVVQRMPQSVKNAETKRQWPKNAQHDEEECPDHIDA